MQLRATPGHRALDMFVTETAPDAVLNYPSMTNEDEKSLLYSLAKNHFRGEGIIVDAGVFLGGSTFAFGCGLRANESVKAGKLRHPKPINSYDLAIWDDGMDKYLPRPAVKKALAGRKVAVGQSFERILRDLLTDYEDLIDWRIGNIIELARTEAPVEIAFYDCLKTRERDWAAFRAFAPHYIPGHTVVIQQDWFYEGAPDHKVRQELLADHFSYLGRAKDSAVFLFERPFTGNEFEADSLETLSLDRQLELLRQAAARADEPLPEFRVRLAGVSLCLERGEPERARAELDDIAARYADQLADRSGWMFGKFEEARQRMPAESPAVAS